MGAVAAAAAAAAAAPQQQQGKGAGGKGKKKSSYDFSPGAIKSMVLGSLKVTTLLRAGGTQA